MRNNIFVSLNNWLWLMNINRNWLINNKNDFLKVKSRIEVYITGREKYFWLMFPSKAWGNFHKKVFLSADLDQNKHENPLGEVLLTYLERDDSAVENQTIIYPSIIFLLFQLLDLVSLFYLFHCFMLPLNI